METALEGSGGEMSALRKGDAFQGLTVKQEGYCQARMAGANMSEAYIEAYDAENSSMTTIGRHALECERHDKIQARLRQLVHQREQQTSLLPKVHKAFVLDGVTGLALHAKSEAVQLRAYELLGKSVGIDLFRETKVVVHKDRTVEDVDRDLREMLDRAKLIEGSVNQSPADSAPDDSAPADIKPKRKRKPRA